MRGPKQRLSPRNQARVAESHAKFASQYASSRTPEAEHGRKSGADMKKLLDPNSASPGKSYQVQQSDDDE